jgi:hypothetical protein
MGVRSPIFWVALALGIVVGAQPAWSSTGAPRDLGCTMPKFVGQAIEAALNAIGPTDPPVDVVGPREAAVVVRQSPAPGGPLCVELASIVLYTSPWTCREVPYVVGDPVEVAVGRLKELRFDYQLSDNAAWDGVVSRQEPIGTQCTELGRVPDPVVLVVSPPPTTTTEPTTTTTTTPPPTTTTPPPTTTTPPPTTTTTTAAPARPTTPPTVRGTAVVPPTTGPRQPPRTTTPTTSPPSTTTPTTTTTPPSTTTTTTVPTTTTQPASTTTTASSTPPPTVVVNESSSGRPVAGWVAAGGATVAAAALVSSRLVRRQRRLAAARDVDVRLLDDDTPTVEYGHDGGDEPEMRFHLEPGELVDHVQQGGSPEVNPHD